MNKLLNIISTIFVITAFFLVSYMILLKLTGHSPTLTQVNTTLVAMLIALSLRTQHKLGKFEEFMEHNREDIKEIKSDIKDVKKELSSKFEKVDKELIFIKTKLSQF